VRSWTGRFTKVRRDIGAPGVGDALSSRKTDPAR
jgi:hypothetical protein